MYIVSRIILAMLLVAIVEMQDKVDTGFKFVPDNLVVHVGDSVKFVNNGSTFHNATNGDWDTDLLKPGEDATIKFDKVGKFDYWCTPHKASMTGKIEVK